MHLGVSLSVGFWLLHGLQTLGNVVRETCSIMGECDASLKVVNSQASTVPTALCVFLW